MTAHQGPFVVAHTSAAPAAPPVAAKYSGIRKAMRVEAGLLVTIAAMLVLVDLFGYLTLGIGGILALALALAPVPLLFALGLWLDRFEPEPVWLLMRLFLWGATMSIIVSGIFNSATFLVAGEAAALLISAPIVEEAMKGLALLWVWRRRREHYSGVLDGIVYSLFVGLGFAVVENVQYYALSWEELGAEGLAGVVFIRGVLTPFLHPFFTMFTGIALALALRHRGLTRLLLPLMGYATAVFLHALWNSGIGVVLYPVLFVPLFIFVVRRMLQHRRREAEVLSVELEPEVQAGVLSREEVERLRDAPIDLGSYLGAVRDSDHPLHRQRRIHHAAFALAAHRRARRELPGLSTEASQMAAAEPALVEALRAAKRPAGAVA